MSGETVKIRVSIRTNNVNSECADVVEFDRAEWEAMDDVERENACRPHAFDMMEWGFSEENAG